MNLWPVSQHAFHPLLPQIGTGNVEVVADGAAFAVTFTGVYGDVPLLIADPPAGATISSSVDGATEGAAPFRKEIQAFSCPAALTGDLLLNWRGKSEVTVAANADLATFASAVSAGLTTVTAVGNDPNNVCSGELVYVTFEEVHKTVESVLAYRRRGTQLEEFRRTRQSDINGKTMIWFLKLLPSCVPPLQSRKTMFCRTPGRGKRAVDDHCRGHLRRNRHRFDTWIAPRSFAGLWDL